MRTLFTNRIASLLIGCFFLLFSQNIFGQCPAAPAANPVGYVVTTLANQAAGFTLAAGQTLVIQSGTYTGSINNLDKTATIYVYPGATFNPSGINSPAGKIINCGTASIPGFNLPTMASTDSLFIMNYNIMTLTGSYNTNGNNSSWLNGLGAKMTFTQSVTNFRDVTFINNGNVFMKSSFNTGAVSAPHKNNFINHDSITVDGDITLDAAIFNDGFLFSKGSMTLNSGGNINNGCFFETDKNFNYSSQDTLIVTGLTWVGKPVDLTGLISTTTGSTVVTGVGTSFLSELLPGSLISNSAGRLIGVVSSITNNNNLILTSGALFTYLNSSLYKQFDSQALFQGKYVKVLGNGFIQGANFEKSGTVFAGNGNMYFTRKTKIQGGNSFDFGIDNTASYHLNFFDTSPNPDVTKYFDEQNIAPSPFLTRSSVIPKDNTFIPSTCSSIIKGDFCKLAGNKPNAGNDTTFCNTTTSITLKPQTGTSRRWTTSTGPSAFAITKQTAAATGLTGIGDYLFILTDTSNAARCSDTVKVTRLASPTVTAPTTAPFCSGVAFSTGIITTSGTGVIVIDWTRAAVTGISQAAGSGTGINPATGFSETLTNTTNASITVRYVLTPRNPACTGVPVNYDVVVKPLPVLSVFATSTLCSGNNSDRDITSSIAGTTITWTNAVKTLPSGGTITGMTNQASPLLLTNIAPPPFAFTQTLNNSGTTTATVKYTFIPVANGCTGASDTTLINVKPRPVLTDPSDQILCNMASTTAVTFASTVAGTTYGWSNSNTAIGLGASGVGDIPAFTATNTGTTNIVGTITVTPTANLCPGIPQTFTITVKPTPVLTDPSDQVLCNTASTTAVNFVSSVAGTTYGWANSNTTIGLGATGTGNIPVFTATNTGTTNIVGNITVTPTANLCPGTPQVFSITVKPTPVLTDPSDQILCNTASTTAVNFVSSVTGTTFGWANSNTTIGLGATGTGNISSFTATNTGTTNTVGTITVTPTANLCPGTPQDFTITVKPTPILTDPSDQILCNTASTTAVTFVSSVTGTTFGWANSNTTIGLGATGAGNIPSFTATNTGTANILGTITVTPTANLCPGAPQDFTITVKPTPTLTDPSDQILCNTASTTAVTFASSVAGTTFGWANSNTSIGLGATGTGNISSFTATNTGTTNTVGTITVTPTANLCPGAPQDFTITVKPTPILTDPSDQILCNTASTTAVNFVSSVTGTTFGWSNSNIAIGLGLNGTGNIPVFTATNTGTANIVGNITVTPTANLCPGTPQVFSITVKPTPVLTDPSDQILCNTASTTAVNFVSSVTGTTFGWANSNTTIGLGATGTGNISVFTAINTGTANTVGTITVTPTANLCPGAPQDFTITVKPTPILTDPSDEVVCNTASTTAVNFVSSVTGTTFGWANSNTTIGLGLNGTGNIPAFTATNTGITNIVGNITVTPTANLCPGSPQVFSITVRPSPVINTATTGVVCSGIPQNYTINSVVGATYTWRRALVAGITELAVTGQTANSITEILTNTTTSSIPVRYIIEPVSVVGSCPGLPFNYDVTVNPSTIPGTASANPPILCTSGTNSTTLSLNGNTGTIQWQQSLNGTPPWGNIIGENGSSYNTPALTDTIYYRASVKSGVCATLTSNVVTVIVNPLPSATLAVTASPLIICAGAKSTITITNSQNGVKYRFYDLTAPVLGNRLLDSLIGDGKTISKAISIPTVGLRTITVFAEIGTCIIVRLNNEPQIQVNPGTDNSLAVSLAPATICVGSSVTISIAATQVGVTYEIEEAGVVKSSAPQIGNGGTRNFVITGLAPGTHVLTPTAFSVACTKVDLASKSVLVNPNPNSTPVFTDTTVCSDAPVGTNIKINITNAIPNVTYEFRLGGVLKGSVTATATTASLVIPVSTLNPVANVITRRALSVQGLSGVCTPFTYTDSSIIIINPKIDPTRPTFSDPTTCAKNGNVTVNITNAVIGVSYNFKLNGISVQTIVASSNPQAVLIPISKLDTLANTIVYRNLSIEGSILNCGSVLFTDSAKITINPSINPGFTTFGNDTICSTDAQVAIDVTNAIIGVTYEFKNGATILATTKATSTSFTQTINKNLFLPLIPNRVNPFNLTVEGSVVGGCGTTIFTDRPIVIINPDPSGTVPVFSDPIVCATVVPNRARIKITNAVQGVKYVFSLGTVKIDSVVARSASDSVDVLISKLNPIADSIVVRTLSVTGSVAGCLPANYSDKSIVTINPDFNPNYTTFSNDTICSNGTPLPSVNIRVTNAIVGLKYVFINVNTRIDSIVAIQKSFVRTIPIAKFVPLVADQINTYNLEVEGSAVAGSCAPKRFTSKPVVVINPELKKGLPLFTDTVVCPSATNIRINIKNAIKGVKYVFSLGNTKIDSVTAKGITDFITVKIADLNPVLNQTVIRKLSVVGSIKNCASQLFDDSAKITINPEIDPAFTTFSNDTVCSTTDSATIRISNSIVGVKYVFINGTTRLDSVTAIATSTIKKIAVSKFTLTGVTTVFTLNVEGSIQGVGCTPKTFADKPVVVINRLPSANPTVSATGPICQGGTSKVTINPTELGVTYTISDNGKTVGTLVGTGTSAFVDVVLNDLGKRKIDVVASILKCGAVILSDTGTVQVNKGSDITLVVTASDTICFGQTAKVTIEKAQLGVIYEVFELTTSVSTKITGTGKDTSFVISGLSVGSHTFRIQATTPGCGPADLLAKPVVQVNALLTDVNLVLIGDTVCNTATTATLTIKNTQVGVTYQAIFGGNPIGTAVKSTGGTVVLTLPVGTGGLPIDTNTINISGTIKGCGTVVFGKTGTILVYPILVPDFPKFSDPIVCANNGTATINLTGTIGGVKYVFSLGNTKIDSVTATGTTASLIIALNKLNPIANQITIRSLSVVGSISDCDKVTFTDSAKITINPDIDITFSTFSNDTVCSNAANATITISNSIVGVKYVFINGTTRLDSVTATTTNTVKTIAVSKFTLTGVTNVFTLSVEGSIQGVGCTPKTFADKPVVVINAEPDTNLILVPGPTVCVGSASTVTIKNATVGVTYTLIDNGVVSTNSQKGLGTDLTFTVLPKLGNNVYGFNATIAGCTIYKLKNSVTIIANPGPDVNVNVTEVSPICFGDSTIITVSNTIATSFYQVLENNLPVSDSVKGGGTIRFGVKNLAVGNHLLVVRASTKGCGYAYLTDTAKVTVNPLPDSTLAVDGDTVCINVGTTNVKVSKTAIGETYTLFEGTKQIGIPTLSAGGDLLISVPIGGTGLAIGRHKLKVTSSIGGCKLITLKDSAIVVVNDKQDGNLKVVGDTVCSNSPNATVTISGTKVGETYQAYINTVKIGNPQLSTGGDVVLILPVGKPAGLDTGSYIVQVKSFILGCGTLDLAKQANIRVNPLPDSTLAVDGDTVCGNSGNAIVTVSKTAKGETYTLFEGKRIVGVPTISAGGNLDILVPLSGANGLTLGLHTLSVQSSIAGCAIITLKDSAKVLVNDQPSLDLVVIGGTVCSNSPNATVTILGTKVGESYQAFINNVAIGNKEISKGDTVILILPVGKPLGLDTGTYIVSVKSEIPGCGIIELSSKATVRVNGLPSENLKVNGDTICETTAFAEVTINATTKGEIYQAFEGLKPVGTPVTSTGGIVTLQLPSATLGLGLHKITFTADIAGCAIVQLKDTANVLVNKLPDIDLEVQGDTVCSNSTEATVTIFGTKPTEIYQAFLNGKAISNAVVSKGDTVKLTIPISNLKVGGNKVNVVASIAGCTDVNLKDSADVLVNQLPDLALTMLGDTVCSNSTEGFVKIFDTKVGEIYTVYVGTTPLDTITSIGGTTTFTVPVSKLKIGNNIITAQSAIAGCGVVDLDTNTIVRVNTLPSDTLEVIGDTVCESAISVDVTIKGTSIGESYQAFENNQALGSPVVSAGGDVILTIPVAGTLTAGLHKINVQSSINGCAIIDLKDTADVFLNKTPKLNLDVIGDTVCSNSDTATVAIKGTQAVEIYTALLNGVEVSAPVISQGGTVYLKIPVSKLKPDTNIVSIRSSIEGCSDQLLDKKAVVIVNGLPDSTLAVIGDTVCSSEIAAKVTIKNTTKSIIYTAYIGRDQIGQPVTSSGGDVVLTLPVVSLQPDTNRITIVASIDGCSDVILDKQAIVILNKQPETNLSLTGSVVCSTAEFASLTISPSDKNAVYQVLLGGIPIGNPVIGTGVAITANLPVNKLKIDTNIVSVAINISGCNGSLVNKTAKVVVNKLPGDDLITDGSTVCSDMANASVRVYGTQRNVVYQAYDPINPIGAAVTSRGGEITLILPVSDLQKGMNKIVVRASVDACATVTLKDTADVFVNTLPNPDISVTGSSVCPGQDGTVTIDPTQLNVIYSVLVNGVTTSSTVTGDGGSKTIVVPFSLLTKRNNEITISADIQACRTITLAKRGYIGAIVNNGPGISGDSILCFGDTASYSVEPIENAVAYNWTITSKNGLAKFITPNTFRKITVQSDTFNFRLKMTPVSTFGTCETVAMEDSITVEDTVKGVGNIWGRDTVCVKDIDTLHIEGIRNATYYTWHIPEMDTIFQSKVFRTDTIYRKRMVDNATVIDTIIRNTAYDRHEVQYLLSGLQTIYVKPFMRCKNINGAYADSVVKIVKVLENAIAEAGEYEDPQFSAESISIQLNGSGSSTDSRRDTLNSYSYKWYADTKTPGQILNQTTLYDATLKPEVEETKVYLIVTNKNGFCPAKDSTTIKVQFEIDIPNVFSPNGDGNHDRWEIKNLNKLYPNAVMTVFNKWGSIVYVSESGYPEAWDGTRNGQDLPVATYYYLLDTKSDKKFPAKSVTIIR